MSSHEGGGGGGGYAAGSPYYGYEGKGSGAARFAGAGGLNSINRLALEGLLAVVGSIAQQCNLGTATAQAHANQHQHQPLQLQQLHVEAGHGAAAHQQAVVG